MKKGSKEDVLKGSQVSAYVTLSSVMFGNRQFGVSLTVEKLLVRGGDGKFLIEENVVFDKESLVSALRYIGLPHTHTCQPAAGGTPSIPLPSSS